MHDPQVQRGPAADDFLNTRLISGCLSSFGLFAGLFLDLPVREWVLVLASRALPCTFRRIRTTFMKHLDDQMAMQTHRGLAMNHIVLRFCKFRSAGSNTDTPPVYFSNALEIKERIGLPSRCCQKIF